MHSYVKDGHRGPFQATFMGFPEDAERNQNNLNSGWHSIAAPP
jgi:hypothetical protein